MGLMDHSNIYEYYYYLMTAFFSLTFLVDQQLFLISNHIQVCEEAIAIRTARLSSLEVTLRQFSELNASLRIQLEQAGMLCSVVMYMMCLKENDSYAIYACG